mgnify:CR=1 FL=1
MIPALEDFCEQVLNWSLCHNLMEVRAYPIVPGSIIEDLIEELCVDRVLPNRLEEHQT